MSTTARIAVVGAGWWATTAHLPAIHLNPDAELAAIVDPDADRLAAAVSRFQPQASFATVDELLTGADVDGVVIAVPHALHHPLAMKALQAGKHVLLEKPMVIDPAHGEQLVSAAHDHRVELVIGYPWHYSPQVLELRRRICGGEIGQIEHVSCLYASIVRALYRGDPEAYRGHFGYAVNAPLPDTYSDTESSGGGQGQTQVTHAAALLLWMTGLEVAAVSAFTSNSGLAVDISDSVAVEFASGAVGVLSSTGTVTEGQREILEYRIFGDSGDVLFDVNEGSAEVRMADGTVDRLREIEEAERYPMFAPVDNLVDIVLGRGANGSPAEIGLATARFVAGMYRSALSRRAVAVGPGGEARSR